MRSISMKSVLMALALPTALLMAGGTASACVPTMTVDQATQAYNAALDVAQLNLIATYAQDEADYNKAVARVQAVRDEAQAAIKGDASGEALNKITELYNREMIALTTVYYDFGMNVVDQDVYLQAVEKAKAAYNQALCR